MFSHEIRMNTALAPHDGQMAPLCSKRYVTLKHSSPHALAGLAQQRLRRLA